MRRPCSGSRRGRIWELIRTQQGADTFVSGSRRGRVSSRVRQQVVMSGWSGAGRRV